MKFGEIVLTRYYIVYVWSQHDGGNAEQWTIGYGCRQNQEAKLKIVGGVIPYNSYIDNFPDDRYDMIFMSWMVQTSLEDLIKCIKLLPLFPTRLQVGLSKNQIFMARLY